MSADVTTLQADLKAAYSRLAEKDSEIRRAQGERTAAIKRRDEAVDNEQAFRKNWGEAVAEAREWKARCERAEADLAVHAAGGCPYHDGYAELLTKYDALVEALAYIGGDDHDGGFAQVARAALAASRPSEET